MLDRKETQKVLDDFGKFIITEARKNLRSSNASKKLYNSLEYETEAFENSISFEFNAEDYWKFINYGVAGIKSGNSLKNYRFRSKGGVNGLKGMPPPSKFDKWNIIRGRDNRDDLGRFLTRKQLNFKTAVGVFYYGIDSTEFITEPFERAYENLPEDIIEAYGLDLENFIKFTLRTDANI